MVACPDFDCVAILEEGALRLVIQSDWRGAIPREFEQAAPALAFGAADGTTGEDVTGTHWAAIGGVVDELLADVPVEVAVVGAGQQGAHPPRSFMPGLQGDIEVRGSDAL